LKGAVSPVHAPEGWLSSAPNQGWIYRERVSPALVGLQVSAFYAARHRHSDQGVWRDRLAAGEIHCNGVLLRQDIPLASGDQLAWHRPPWLEAAVPATWAVVYDDGDLHVIDKPAGLPVLPAGGWLEHTVLRLLEGRHSNDPGGIPRPVHRLGRFTSGLLVCARRPQTRAWLSARLRESTVAGLGSPATPQETEEPNAGAADDRDGAFRVDGAFNPESVGGVGGGDDPAGPVAEGGCRKLYRALLVPGVLALEPGESLPISTPIGRRPHPQLGQIWCAADGSHRGDLAARSTLTLEERAAAADLVQVAIASGRPHQIRIHCAAVGAPLLGDPLYAPGGLAAPAARPGDGGYRLQAWRLSLERPGGGRLELEAPRALGW
jgi:23S rRNA pseudouridine1911/1915/1917 synthase